MYENSGASITAVGTGAASTIAGITVLPDTGNNTLLYVLSLVSLVSGLAMIALFIIARIINVVHRNNQA